MLRLILVLMTLAMPAKAQDVAGEFDYYVLALSWSPTWCALEGDDRGSPQCDPEADFGWVLHGLWPQYEQGWPSNCRHIFRNPSRGDTAAQAGLYGSSGSAWHQWNKHGSCSGLAPDDFYALSRLAYDSITRPEVFRRLENPVTLPASLIEEAFLRDNPQLSADQITITCRSSRIQEARICLTRNLEPRRCGSDVIRDCSLEDALFDPIR
ncbi:MAG: ribonuclease T2 [Pseudomonadota bacterium]